MSIRKGLFLASIFLGFFCFKVIGGIPADAVFSYINKKFPLVQLINPRGSVWNGTASQLQIKTPNGNLEFEEFKWKLTTWRLLIGEVALSVKSKPSQQFINADVSVNMFKTIAVKGLNMQLPAQFLSDAAKLPVKAGGTLKLVSPEAKFKKNILVSLSSKSRLSWNDANIVTLKKVFLGDYFADLSLLDNQKIKIDLGDNNAALELDGIIEVNSQSFKYNANVLLKPTSDFPQEMSNMLGMVAKKNSQGQYLIKRSN